MEQGTLLFGYTYFQNKPFLLINPSFCDLSYFWYLYLLYIPQSEYISGVFVEIISNNKKQTFYVNLQIYFDKKIVYRLFLMGDLEVFLTKSCSAIPHGRPRSILKTITNFRTFGVINLHPNFLTSHFFENNTF